MSPAATPTVTSALNLATTLFVQAEGKRAPAATTLMRDHGVGIVYTLDPRRRRTRYTDALQVITYTRERAPEGQILLDANLYSGRSRMIAGASAAGPTRAWVAAQHRLGLSHALTDSGYVAAGATAGLTATLQAGAGMGAGVLTVLPLATRWLTHDADVLCQNVSRCGTPVAIMVENKDDPFDRKNAAAGLVELIATGVPVALLRADTSALGAIAHGAVAGAVGATSGLRHFYPIPDKDGGPDPTKDYLSFVIPDLLGYFSNERFLNAYDNDPTNPAWRCGCRYCGGSPLTWINAAGQHDIPQPASVPVGFDSLADAESGLPPIKEQRARGRDARGDAAFQHSVAAIAGFYAELTGSAQATGVSLASAWSAMCEHAQMQHFAVTTADGQGWEPRPAFGRWRALAATPEGSLPPASSPERAQKGSPPSI